MTSPSIHLVVPPRLSMDTVLHLQRAVPHSVRRPTLIPGLLDLDVGLPDVLYPFGLHLGRQDGRDGGLTVDYGLDNFEDLVAARGGRAESASECHSQDRRDGWDKRFNDTHKSLKDTCGISISLQYVARSESPFSISLTNNRSACAAADMSLTPSPQKNKVGLEAKSR